MKQKPGCPPYWRHDWEIVNGRKKCRRCGTLNPLGVPPELRYWDYVDKNGPTISKELGPCWMWTGAKLTDGYAMYNFGAKLQRCVRVMWTKLHGQIPDGQVIRHKCDTRACVNPEHLELGTQKDNIADMLRRHGVRTAKLTAETVYQMRRLHAGGMTTRQLGKKYGVSQGTAAKAIRGDTWKVLAPINLSSVS